MNSRCDEEERYCEDCTILIEALRDMEQQCREAEDESLRTDSFLSFRETEILVRDEQAYLARLEKLQRRRNCALELLLKHQALEHAER